MRALLKQTDFVFFWAARFVATLAVQIQAVTIGWQVYTLARETGHNEGEGAFLLGMVGLAQFIPLFFLTLTAGETADRHDRQDDHDRRHRGRHPVRRRAWACWPGRGTPPCGRSSPSPCCSGPAAPSSRPPPAPWGLCWCRARCCRAPSPGTRCPGRAPRSSARPWAACCAPSRRPWPSRRRRACSCWAACSAVLHPPVDQAGRAAGLALDPDQGGPSLYLAQQDRLPARSRWTCSPCCWAGPPPCCRCSPATCCMSGPRASASCGPPRPWARPWWRSSWPATRSAAARAC